MMSIEVIAEAVEAPLPEAFVLEGPAGDQLKLGGNDAINSLAAFAAFGYQTGVAEDLEMLRNGGLANAEQRQQPVDGRSFGESTSRIFRRVGSAMAVKTSVLAGTRPIFMFVAIVRFTSIWAGQ